MDNIIVIFILVLMKVLNNVLLGLFINDRKYMYWYIGYI